MSQASLQTCLDSDLQIKTRKRSQSLWKKRRFITRSSAKHRIKVLYVPRAHESDPDVALVIFPGSKREEITLQGTGRCEKRKGGP